MKKIDLHKIPIGYILLYKSNNTFFNKQIVNAQKVEGHSEENSQYVHVEPYIGQGYAIDANPIGIKARSVLERNSKRYVKVIKPWAKDFEYRRYNTAIWSTSRCNLPYGFTGIIWFKVKKIFKTNIFSGIGDFCSELTAWGLWREYGESSLTNQQIFKSLYNLNKYQIQKLAEVEYQNCLPKPYNQMMPADFLNEEYFEVVDEGEL